MSHRLIDAVIIANCSHRLLLVKDAMEVVKRSQVTGALECLADGLGFLKGIPLGRKGRVKPPDHQRRCAWVGLTPRRVEPRPKCRRVLRLLFAVANSTGHVGLKSMEPYQH
jgi:hypothetical protein